MDIAITYLRPFLQAQLALSRSRKQIEMTKFRKYKTYHLLYMKS